MDHLKPVLEVKAVSPVWFPAGFQAVIWRNFGIVPVKNIAAALQCAEEKVKEAAKDMGLPDMPVNPLWKSRGYLTIIRNNWHISSYEQILILLQIDEKELAFILKEDDFMWVKMGGFKARADDCLYRELTKTEKIETEKIKKRAGEYFPATINLDNSFEFLNGFYKKSEYRGAAAENSEGFRIAYSYFAVYGDPLLNEELDPYPDELLRQYAQMGVNGVWLQGILYQLADFGFDPDLSRGREKRIKNLNKLIKRAKKYNIGVYLYLNEPRSMPEKFFEKYPGLKGEKEYDCFAMCTSCPEVIGYLYKGTKQLFTEARGLAGFIAITMSENLTNCYSRVSPENITCERCKEKGPAKVVAEVNNALAKGAHDADPAARAISWIWSWGDDWALDAVDLLCENQILQCTSEEGLITNIGGVKGSVLDYTISQPGPGKKSKSVWEHAKGHGLELSAKIQINVTWELAAVPYIPAFDLIETHIKNLTALDIKNFQFCWTLGGHPSLNMQMAGYLIKNPKKSAADFLCAIFGEDLGRKIYGAQKKFSDAFAEFPFHIGVAYNAPQNSGAAAPFYMQNTGYGATMVGFPYDALDSWRAVYPVDVYEGQMLKVEAGMESALEKFMEIENPDNGLLADMILNAEAALCHMRSVCCHIAFIRARDAKDRGGMLEAVKKERKNVLRLIGLRKKDSRIGFEASNHYFYTLQDLAEKLLNLDWCEGVLNKI